MAAVIAVTAAVCVGMVQPRAVRAAGPLSSAANYDVVEQPFEERLGSATKQLVRDVRRWFRRSYWLMSRSLTTWGRWLRRAALYIALTMVFLLADRGLLAAWRRDGLQVLVNNVPLMLYVYTRLLFTSRASLLPKIVLLAAVIYGVRWSDLVPDRAFIPGLVDDTLIIALASRVFVYSCPEELVTAYATKAIDWRRRMLTLQRSRGR